MAFIVASSADAPIIVPTVLSMAIPSLDSLLGVGHLYHVPHEGVDVATDWWTLNAGDETYPHMESMVMSPTLGAVDIHGKPDIGGAQHFG